MPVTEHEYRTGAARVLEGANEAAVEAWVAVYCAQEGGRGLRSEDVPRAFAAVFGERDFSWPLFDAALAALAGVPPEDWPMQMSHWAPWPDEDGELRREDPLAWLAAGLRNAALVQLCTRHGITVPRRATRDVLLEALRRGLSHAAVAEEVARALAQEQARRRRFLWERKVFLLAVTTSHAAHAIVRERQLAEFPLVIVRASGCEYRAHRAQDGLVLPEGNETFARFRLPLLPACGCYLIGASSLEAARILDRRLPPAP